MSNRTHEQELSDFLNKGIAPSNPKLFLKRIQSTVPVEEKTLVNENEGATEEKHELPPLKVEGDATGTTEKPPETTNPTK